MELDDGRDGRGGHALARADRAAPRSRARLAIVLGAVALLGTLPARASDHSWTWHDTALEATYFAVQAVDWMQTRNFLDRGRLEMNPILGQRPTRGELLAYNLVTLTLHAAVSYALPKPYREIWQVMSIGVETWQVGSNMRTEGSLRIALP